MRTTPRLFFYSCVLPKRNGNDNEGEGFLVFDVR